MVSDPTVTTRLPLPCHHAPLSPYTIGGLELTWREALSGVLVETRLLRVMLDPGAKSQLVWSVTKMVFMAAASGELCPMYCVVNAGAMSRIGELPSLMP
jgi:hypothetical protein